MSRTVNRIHLNKTDFEIPESKHWTQDEDVILGIRLFNKTLAKKVMTQILSDQKKIERMINK